jgi:glutamine synthetase
LDRTVGMYYDTTLAASVKQTLIDAGVEYCFPSYVDVHGIPKAKAVPIQCFEEMCAGSELFTVGALDGMGLVGPQEDECSSVPDLNSFVVLPWDTKYAWFASNLYYHDAPYHACSRFILQKVLEKARRMGFIFNLGIETEFYVLRQVDGRYVPITEVDFKGLTPGYDVFQTLRSMSFLDPMVKYMNQLGWGVFSFDQEGGKGQYEFDFAYSDALTMADRFIFLRLMAKSVAKSIGAIATFMPKPFSHDFRSGAHFNMSLADIETGKNLFERTDADTDTLAAKYNMPFSQLTLNFVAGLLQHAPALAALTCPSYNSYQGLVAQGDMPDISWAPVLRCYGRNNRSAMLRLPMNRTCIENRTPDIGCNPYLAAAFSLAAGLEGIEKNLDPGLPLSSNLYDLTAEERNKHNVTFLPRTLLHALEAFEADPLVKEVFGSEFQTIYLKQKMREWDNEFYKVSEEARDRNMTFI